MNDDDLIRRGDVIAALTDLPIFNVIDSDETNARAVSMIHKAQQAIRALAASQPADPVTNAGCCQQVKVKPLVWRMAENRHGWEADGLGCQYHVPHDKPDRRKRCEADHESRILSVLEWKTTVSPEVQALVYSAEKLLEAYSAIFGAGNPWGDELRAAIAKIKKKGGATMSDTPERIWAHPTERNPVNKAWQRGKWKDHDSGASGDAGYIREDTVTEMIRQAMADAEAKALREVVVKIRPSLSPSGNGVVNAALHQKADEIEAMIPKGGEV